MSDLRIVDTLNDLDSSDLAVRDHARARLGSVREIRYWRAIFQELSGRRERGEKDLGDAARAILRQECLDFQRREQPPHSAWVELVARVLTDPTLVSEQKRAVQDFVATVLENPAVPRSARREFVELVLARAGQKPECQTLVRLMARVARGMAFAGARPYLLEQLAAVSSSQPELQIDLLQSIARVGKPEDIPQIAVHLRSDSPGVAQSAFDAIVALSDDAFAWKTLLFDRVPGEHRDEMRAALVHSRFLMPRWLSRRLLAWVLRFERGPRARASLIEVIARGGGSSNDGASTLRVLIAELRRVSNRDEREKLRSAIAEINAPRSAWRSAKRANDLVVQAMAFAHLEAFAEMTRRWASMPVFLRLRALETARDSESARARVFLEHVYASERGLWRLKAQLALAGRPDVKVDTQVERLRQEQRIYGRSEVLIELAENRKVDASSALGEFCSELDSQSPVLAYAQLRATVRLRDPSRIARALGIAATFEGCLRERCVELIGDSLVQEVLPLAALTEESFSGQSRDGFWREVLLRLGGAAWSDRQWEDLLVASRRSAAILDFVSERDLFWRAGIRGVIRGFMSRDRWNELRASIRGFDGRVDKGLLGEIHREMDLREAT